MRTSEFIHFPSILILILIIIYTRVKNVFSMNFGRNNHDMFEMDKTVVASTKAMGT